LKYNAVKNFDKTFLYPVLHNYFNGLTKLFSDLFS